MNDKMNNPKKAAKLDLLRDLRKMAMGMINDGSGEEMPGHMQKVMVAAKDKEGLKEGLDKAEDILGGDEESEESPEHEMGESSDEESSEGLESPEELKAKIKELQAKLEQISK